MFPNQSCMMNDNGMNFNNINNMGNNFMGNNMGNMGNNFANNNMGNMGNNFMGNNNMGNIGNNFMGNNNMGNMGNNNMGNMGNMGNNFMGNNNMNNNNMMKMMMNMCNNPNNINFMNNNNYQNIQPMVNGGNFFVSSVNNNAPTESVLKINQEQQFDPFENWPLDGRINFIFDISNGRRINMAVPKDITIAQLLDGFFKKMSILSPLLRRNIFFLFNGTNLKQNSQKLLTEFKLNHNMHIVVVDAQNLLGA